MKRIKQTAALAALMALSFGGGAQATEGWYGRVDAGYSIDGELDIGGDEDYDWGAPTLDDDWSQHLGLGYALSNGFRLEGELSHRFNQLEPIVSAQPLVGIDAGGDVHVWSAMFNAYYDFNRGGRIEPYVGLGVGAARVNMSGDDHLPPPTYSFDDSDTVFAYQGLLGVAVGLTERLDLDLGYRYFKADGIEFVADEAGLVDREADYTHQAVTVGLRWQFASPAAPVAETPPVVEAPPPPVATCPQSDFVVYFEWDRAALNVQALEVIDSAVARARECNVSSATLVGHTDTSGSPQYNVALSERRASVVRDALVARGLASSLITAEARGEADLARATADGVREPLNRRTAVTITFQ